MTHEEIKSWATLGSGSYLNRLAEKSARYSNGNEQVQHISHCIFLVRRPRDTLLTGIHECS